MKQIYLELFRLIRKYINHLDRNDLKLLKRNYKASKNDLVFLMTIDILSTYTDEEELELLVYGNSFLNNLESKGE